MIEIDKKERIVRIVRKHWFVLLGDMVVLVFLVAIPVALLFLFGLIPLDALFTFTGSEASVGSFFLFAWLLIVWMIAWHMWTDYYLDVLIVTDGRIFDIEQKGLFSRLSSSFRIDRVQNVTVDQKGIIQTLLNFGTLRIETAGEREDFVAPYISHPYEVKKFLNEMQDRAIDHDVYDRPAHRSDSPAHSGL